MSPHRASPTPPPAAMPFIAFIIGFFELTIFLTRGLKPISIAFAVALPADQPSSVGQPPLARSAPAQKPLPFPVIIIDLIESFFSHSSIEL